MPAQLYYRTRQWVPIRQSEVVTWYETDADGWVQRYRVEGGDQVDLVRGPRYRLEASSSLESCSAEEFLQGWDEARAPARSALPDLPDQEAGGQGAEGKAG